MILGTLDPGHGGNDRANKGPTGYVEADGNLWLAKLLKADLEATGQFKILLTRDSDSSLGLRDRSRIAANFSKEFFISLHSNAMGGSESGKASGPECFYSIDLPNNRAIAQLICDDIAREFKTKNRGAKTWVANPAHAGSTGSTASNPEDYIAVIDEAQDLGIKLVLLIETLFHDNPVEEKILKDVDNLKLISKIITYRLCEYYKVQMKNTVKDTISLLNKHLSAAGINTLDPSYWGKYAVKGQVCNGEWVGIAFERLSKLL